MGLVIYALPIANCVVNATVSCEYPFYERQKVIRELVLNRTEFKSHERDYQSIADAMIGNDIKSIKFPNNGHGNLEIEMLGAEQRKTSGGNQDINSMRVDGKSLFEIFRDRNLMEVTVAYRSSGIEFQKRIYKRGVWQNYTYCPE